MSSRRATVGVVTVTYNSDRFFDFFMSSLEKQTQIPDCVVLVDSGSLQDAFLDRAANFALKTEVIRERNVGFAVGSNLGWRTVRHLDYILFLNPDAFLTPDFLAQATAYLAETPGVGMLTPTLVRFDLAAGSPLNMVDTTGVVRNRAGLLVERDAGQPLTALQQYTTPNEVPWLCGAAMLARREALNAAVEPGDQLFDERFFMYKEDTDLAWRVRRAGWRLMHLPQLVGYHCRGWQDRQAMSRSMRLLTARNEIRMSLKNRSPFVVIGLLKYSLVFLLNV